MENESKSAGEPLTTYVQSVELYEFNNTTDRFKTLKTYSIDTDIMYRVFTDGCDFKLPGTSLIMIRANLTQKRFNGFRCENIADAHLTPFDTDKTMHICPLNKKEYLTNVNLTPLGKNVRWKSVDFILYTDGYTLIEFTTTNPTMQTTTWYTSKDKAHHTTEYIQTASIYENKRQIKSGDDTAEIFNNGMRINPESPVKVIARFTAKHFSAIISEGIHTATLFATEMGHNNDFILTIKMNSTQGCESIINLIALTPASVTELSQKSITDRTTYNEYITIITTLKHRDRRPH